jgi:GT2 family glycosyltransferase
MLPAAPSIVMITHNRRSDVLRTLEPLQALVERGEAAEVVVVDNASTDGTAAAVRAAHPRVRVLPQQENLGAVGRTVGVEAVRSPVVAFADDDSWWAPGALPAAARLFAEHPRLALVHGRVVLEPGGVDDDACARLASGPREPGLPGPSVIGHLACGAVVRREAFLAAGGYSRVLGFGGEEALLALDLAAAGWAQCYVPSLVAHHRPSPLRDEWPVRWARYRRNDTLTALLRLPASFAARETARLLGQAATDPVVRRELGPFLLRLPAVARRRRRVPEHVWHQFRVSRGLAPAPTAAAD